jgi:hypothetical protein
VSQEPLRFIEQLSRDRNNGKQRVGKGAWACPWDNQGKPWLLEKSGEFR